HPRRLPPEAPRRDLLTRGVSRSTTATAPEGAVVASGPRSPHGRRDPGAHAAAGRGWPRRTAARAAPGAWRRRRGAGRRRARLARRGPGPGPARGARGRGAGQPGALAALAGSGPGAPPAGLRPARLPRPA